MAEIKVDKVEHKRSILPWILGLALLALALWGISRMMDDDRDEGVRETSSIESIEPNGSAATAELRLAA
ncbi:MAG TPA: hypothetical protein VLQ45_32910 [Thermoanaerobaculia bacterium]|nr:hypothetical protein [Thermoanaerobaculia bacterium]